MKIALSGFLAVLASVIALWVLVPELPRPDAQFWLRWGVLFPITLLLVIGWVAFLFGEIEGANRRGNPDVVAPPTLPDLSPRSVVSPTDRHRSAPLLRDVRTDFAWLAPPERATNGDKKRYVPPARTRPRE